MKMRLPFNLMPSSKARFLLRRCILRFGRFAEAIDFGKKAN
jgi:hypothetical protein